MMKLISTITICILILQVESQSNPFNSGQHRTDWNRANYPIERQSEVERSQNNQFLANTQSTKKQKETDYDSYLQAISRNQNSPNEQLVNYQTGASSDGSIHFEGEPSLDLSPPPFGSNSSPNYYSTQQRNNAVLTSTSEASNVAVLTNSHIGQQQQQNQGDNSRLNNATLALSSFGLNLIKIASQSQTGNVIISPTSIATVLALLQQGATGESQEQITKALHMTPDGAQMAFGTITANMRKRNTRNILNIATNVLVSDTFELNPSFKTVAARGFWSEITPTNFGNPSDAIQKVNAWVASKTNNKITDLLKPGSLSQNTQLVLANAVYFKGIWESRFKPEHTQLEQFHLSNGAKKTVPFMHIRSSYQVGVDPSTGASITILPFESRQYSMMLILPYRKDDVTTLLGSLTVEQLLYYQTFETIEIKLEIPKFTLKSDTDLAPILKTMGITSIFGSNSDLSGVGLFRTFSPQVSNAVHSGFLSVDEHGATASAATSIAAVALSYDESYTVFRADRPFVAVLWDNQFSIPLFIAKIEDPS